MLEKNYFFPLFASRPGIVFFIFECPPLIWWLVGDILYSFVVAIYAIVALVVSFWCGSVGRIIMYIFIIIWVFFGIRWDQKKMNFWIFIDSL